MKQKIYRDKQQVIETFVGPEDVVLDVGFWGQGIPMNNPRWPHRLIEDRARDTYGIDLGFDESLFDPTHYQKASAERFDFETKFSRILAFDLIEHLPNPGLFLDSCARNLADGGKIVITTPNAFALFNISMKMTREDPVTNKDHTLYFNPRTLRQMVEKCGLKVEHYGYLYSVGVEHQESLKKKFLNIVYFILSKFTGKFCEDFVMIITK